jgi:hypothetical protein
MHDINALVRNRAAVAAHHGINILKKCIIVAAVGCGVMQFYGGDIFCSLSLLRDIKVYGKIPFALGMIGAYLNGSSTLFREQDTMVLRQSTGRLMIIFAASLYMTTASCYIHDPQMVSVVRAASGGIWLSSAAWSIGRDLYSYCRNNSRALGYQELESVGDWL